MCKKTEFEVEGWRKIPPLIKILREKVSDNVIDRMKLEMIQINPDHFKSILDYHQYSAALKLSEWSKIDGRTIRDSWIYSHFKNPNTERIKIGLYINNIIPINEKLVDFEMSAIGSYFVIVRGMKTFSYKNSGKYQMPDQITDVIPTHYVECLEIENSELSDAMRHIPVDFPFFEKVQLETTKILRTYGHELSRRHLNKYGKQFAQIKYGRIGQTWHHDSFEMNFVRGVLPCFQLCTIRDSWIYQHFKNPATKNTKLTLYVNTSIVINEKLEENDIISAGNHCVIVKGIKKWTYEANPKDTEMDHMDSRYVECLEIENHTACEQTKYIPVDHPFFEEVEGRVRKIFRRYPGSEQSHLNKYGRDLGKIKYGSLIKTWEDLIKYKMVFIRARYPYYQLKFTA